MNTTNQTFNSYYKNDKLHHAMTFRIPSILLTTKPQERKKLPPLPKLLIRFAHPEGQYLHGFPPFCLVSCTDTDNLQTLPFLPNNSSYRKKAHQSRLRDTSTLQIAGVQTKGRQQQYLFRIPLFKEHIQIHSGGEGKLAFR